MSSLDELRRACDRLSAGGGALAEVFVKEGRVRRSESSPSGFATSMSREHGWAVRVGGGRGRMLTTGSGPLPETVAGVSPSGEPLRLPRPAEAPPTEVPVDDAPLMIEGEARSLIEAVASELERQLPGARLLRGVLEDGASASTIVNSHGLEAQWRHRLCSLRMEALGAGPAPVQAEQVVIETNGQRLQPRALARRLADALVVRGGRRPPARERGEVVLSPSLAAHLVAGLRSLWVGADGAELARRWVGADDHLGSPLLTVVDDGRLPSAPLSSPFDGEGVATGRAVLVRRGRYLQPLVDWRQADPPRWRATGCVRRASWRDVPTIGPSQLFVEPNASVAAHELVASVARGFYLLEALGGLRVELDSGRFAIPVDGFVVVRGAADHAIGRGWLTGDIRALLRGIRGVARDLAFVPDGGLVGSPTLLVTGLELRREL